MFRLALVPVLVLIVIALSVSVPVHANHLFIYKRAESPPTVNYCVNTNFGALNMGYTIAKLRIGDVVRQLNDLSGVKLLWQEVAFNSNCKNQFYVAAMDPYYLAYTSRTISNGKIFSSNIAVNYNIKNWITSGCVTPSATGPFNFLYTIRHELGHANGAGHSTTYSDPTVMWPGYDCTRWSGWSSHDISSFRSVYPE